MKNQLYLIISVFVLGCTSERTNKLSGIWDATNYVKYPFDTISLESGFDPIMERATVKTDSGIMLISHVDDSIIDIIQQLKRMFYNFILTMELMEYFPFMTLILNKLPRTKTLDTQPTTTIFQL